MLNNIIILQVVCREELYYNILITIQMAHFQLHQLIHNINNIIVA